MTRTFDIFISHGWSYDDSFYRILDYLDQISNTYENFDYLNHANPEPETPDLSYTNELKVEYADQISKAETVILLSDLYREPEKDESNLRFWIDYAIENAREHNLPIFGMRPWNETQTPKEIANIPQYWMDWNPESIKNVLQNHL